MRTIQCTLLLSLLAIAACGDSSSNNDNCTAVYATLQKDAYKETAGRTDELWPPHTTTQLTITCGGQPFNTSFQANHGTAPADRDPAGDLFLVETDTITVNGTKAQMAALQAAYATCECSTPFLSMDQLQDQAVQQLVMELSAYATTNLVCNGAVSVQDLIALLQSGDIAGVTAALPTCTWQGSSDLETAFNEGFQMVLQASQETLADYHVCNNDASLQQQLIENFRDTGMVTACDGDSAVCHTPLWFFTP